jgi:hypothetical protein
MGMFTRAGTSLFRSRRKTISIRLSATWSAMPCGRGWLSGLRLGGGPVWGDGASGARINSTCSALGRWLVPRTGASSSMSHKRRRSWTPFADVWPAASHAEVRIGYAERRNNWDWNPHSEHRIGPERPRRAHDPTKARLSPFLFLLQRSIRAASGKMGMHG